jgi:hypothetical protein
MPHESTVGHEDVLPHNDIIASRSRTSNDNSPILSPIVTGKRHPLERTEPIKESVRRYADTPRQFTQVQDDDSDGSKDSDREGKELTPPNESQETESVFT